MLREKAVIYYVASVNDGRIDLQLTRELRPLDIYRNQRSVIIVLYKVQRCGFNFHLTIWCTKTRIKSFKNTYKTVNDLVY